MVYLASYTAKGDLINRLIRYWTNCKASHCELVIDGYGFSSSIKDGGVRRKRINFYDGNWELLALPWVLHHEIIEYYGKTKGTSYGWRDLFCRQLLHIPCKEDQGQFCSEWCASALGLDSGREFSPELLRLVCVDINKIYQVQKAIWFSAM